MVRAGSWLYCVVGHLPVTMIRVPGGAWRGQNLQVIPLSSCLVCLGRNCLKGLFGFGGVMGALKYVVIGVVVVVVVAAALVTTTDTAPGACAVRGFIQRL